MLGTPGEPSFERARYLAEEAERKVNAWVRQFRPGDEPFPPPMKKGDSIDPFSTLTRTKAGSKKLGSFAAEAKPARNALGYAPLAKTEAPAKAAEAPPAVSFTGPAAEDFFARMTQIVKDAAQPSAPPAAALPAQASTGTAPAAPQGRYQKGNFRPKTGFRRTNECHDCGDPNHFRIAQPMQQQERPIGRRKGPKGRLQLRRQTYRRKASLPRALLVRPHRLMLSSCPLPKRKKRMNIPQRKRKRTQVYMMTLLQRSLWPDSG